MSYVYRLHSILCVLLLSEGSNLHVASLIAALMVMCFLGVLTSMRLIFRVFFSFCMLSRVYVWIVLPIHPFRLPWLLLLVVFGLFSHCAAGSIPVIRTHGILVKSLVLKYLFIIWC